MIYQLTPTLQQYAWGSRDFIPHFYGFDNAEGKPYAEAWYGVHPKGPTTATVGERGVTLQSLVESDTHRTLGEAAARRFSTLPFLLKVLSAGQSLSIQVHPTRPQAETGFDAEESAGPPVDAPDRNYRDRNHKPEVLCALTEFWAMRGFRAPQSVADDLDAAGAEWSKPHMEALRRGDRSAAVDLLNGLFSLAEADRERLRAAVVAYAHDRRTAADRADADGPTDTPTGSAGAVGEVHPRGVAAGERSRFDWVLELDRQHPGDIGAIAPIILQVVRLQPGEGVYQPAGVPHAYLCGTGIELMANSDNVLRAGLTPKHIDTVELARVMRPDDGGDPVLTADGDGVYPAPTAEFRLRRIDETIGARTGLTGPAIVLCTDGELQVSQASDAVHLRRGGAVFVTHDGGSFAVTGSGVAFVADLPDVGSTAG